MIVSIITVVKNDFRNIQKTIDSVYNQDYQNIEYIVVDGNSTDKTLAIIKKNKNKISKILSSNDKNLYDALNKGIKISKGSIIGIIHCGDIYKDKSIIKKSVKLLDSQKLDFVISDLEIIKKDAKVFRYVNTSRFFKPFMLSFGIQPPHPTLFEKKKIIKELNYYSTNYKIVGDFDFFCKLFKKKNVKWSNLSITSILQIKGGLSDGNIQDKIDMSNDMIKILKTYNFISIKALFVFKFFLKIKEMIFKK